MHEPLLDRRAENVVTHPADRAAGAGAVYCLRRACGLGHSGIAELLLSWAGAHLTRMMVEIALDNAALNSQTACCALLLDRCAHLNLSASWALCMAASNGDTETVALLLDRGTSLDLDMAVRYAMRLMLKKPCTAHKIIETCTLCTSHRLTQIGCAQEKSCSMT